MQFLEQDWLRGKERETRKNWVTTTYKSNEIRIYNYPHNRITDHCCSFSIYDIERVVSGKRLQEIIDAVNEIIRAIKTQSFC